MFKSITVDAKGNVYIVPQEVLKKHCKMIKPGEKFELKEKSADWTTCYLWINGGDIWTNCPPTEETIKEMIAKKDNSSKDALVKKETKKKTGK